MPGERSLLRCPSLAAASVVARLAAFLARHLDHARLGADSDVPLSGRYVVIDLAGECGYAVIPGEGGGGSITGAWFSGQVGVGFVLPSAESAGTAGEAVE